MAGSRVDAVHREATPSAPLTRPESAGCFGVPSVAVVASKELCRRPPRALTPARRTVAVFGVAALRVSTFVTGRWASSGVIARGRGGGGDPRRPHAPDPLRFVRGAPQARPMSQ